MMNRLGIYLVVAGVALAALLFDVGLFTSGPATVVTERAVGLPKPVAVPVLPAPVVPDAPEAAVAPSVSVRPAPVLVAPPVRPTPQLDDAIRVPPANSTP